MRSIGARFLKSIAVLGLGLGVAFGAGSPAFAGDASEFTLQDVNGQTVSLSQHHGKVVVISFWATWCGPCKVEMPHLEQMYKDLGAKGLVVLSVATDDARTVSQARAHVKKSGFTFPVLLDTQSAVTKVYNPTATLPYTVVIDRNGNIASNHSGYNPGDEAKLKEEVIKLLDKPIP